MRIYLSSIELHLMNPKISSKIEKYQYSFHFVT